MQKNYFIVFNQDSGNLTYFNLEYRWLCADSVRELAEKLDRMSVKFAILGTNIIKDFDSKMDLSKLQMLR